MGWLRQSGQVALATPDWRLCHTVIFIISLCEYYTIGREMQGNFRKGITDICKLMVIRAMWIHTLHCFLHWVYPWDDENVAQKLHHIDGGFGPGIMFFIPKYFNIGILAVGYDTDKDIGISNFICYRSGNMGGSSATWNSLTYSV